MDTILKSCTIPEIRPSGNMYETQNDILIEYTYGGRPRTYKIRRGYMTDGASIPRILWEEIGSPFQPSFIRAAIVHDWMCDNDFSVDEMSDLFFDILRADGVSTFKAGTMEQAVRIYKSFF